VAASLLPLGAPIGRAVVAAAACDPFTTTPVYDTTTPTATSVLGFALGTQEVTPEQSNQYLDAVATESDRVVAATAAVSVAGRDLRYAIVGTAARVTSSALATKPFSIVWNRTKNSAKSIRK
jgi:hypothetical protein